MLVEFSGYATAGSGRGRPLRETCEHPAIGGTAGFGWVQQRVGFGRRCRAPQRICGPECCACHRSWARCGTRRRAGRRIGCIVTSPSDESLADVVRGQAALIADLQARLDRLESDGNSANTNPLRAASHSVQTSNDMVVDPPSRRGFLRLAGAAAAGAAVAVVGNASPAAAFDGGSFTGAETVFTNNGTDSTKAGVRGSFTGTPSGGIGGIGVLGQADGVPGQPTHPSNASAAGVIGQSLSPLDPVTGMPLHPTGFGVYGASTTGYALYAASNGRIGFDAHVDSLLTPGGYPTKGAYKVGDLFTNTNGDTYSCVVGGAATSGGPARFRKLAGPGTTGQLHLVAAARVFDSRAIYDPGNVGLPGGQIVNAQARTINVVNYVPAGATGVMIGLGVTSTLSSGYLTAYPTGTPSPGTVNCYWQAGAQTSNTVIVALNASLQFDVRASLEGGGAVCSADLFGYFR